MLTSIRVDGFRSLLHFEIELNAGLNILVGANGTGKSNFITFLDFAAAFLESNLNNAIGVAKGAASVFSRERFSSQMAKLTFTVCGNGQTTDDPFFDQDDGGAKSVSYTYTCEFVYERAIPAVYVSAEDITVCLGDGAPVTIHRSTSRSDSEFISANGLTPENHDLVDYMTRRMFIPETESKNLFIERLRRFSRPDASILTMFRGSYLNVIFNDLSQIKSINIEPAVARESTPVASINVLEPNGKGLAGTLYQLKSGQYFPRGTRPFVRRLDTRVQKRTYDSIVSWCKEVNPAIEKVIVTLDFNEAQLRPEMEFKFDNSLERYSFTRVSDGTVKWLALATILFLENNTSVIEEPENFLHPFMQEKFIALCREVLHRGNRRSIVISTHSPTLLDCCDPSELTLFELDGAKTRASKIADYQELANVISRSRFGLGHYYKTGALHSDDSRTS